MRTRTRLAAAGLTLMAAAAPLAGAAQGRQVGATGPSAKAYTDKGVAYASITHTSGGQEIVAGNLSDKVLGEGAITYRLKLLPNSDGTFSVKSPRVVLYTPKGSISGTATATVSIAGTSETISKGKLTLTKGTGGLKGYEFHGTFTGTGNLTANALVFNYKGTLTA